MAQIILPTREVERQEAPKESALDKLLKGLQVASSAFGIGSSISNMKTQSQARDINAAREGRDAAEFGIKAQQTTMQAPEGQAGVPITLQTPEGESLTSLRVPKPVDKSMDLALKEADLKNKELMAQKTRLEINAQEKVASGKAPAVSLKPVDIERFGQGRQAVKQLQSLEGIVQENKGLFGPIIGNIGGRNPYDADAQMVQAAVNTAKQTIGKYLEGGVLRKEDEIKYERILPKLGDTPETAQNKLNLMRDLLEQKLTDDLDALTSQGYDVTGINIPELGQRQTAQQQPKQGGGFNVPNILPTAQAAKPFNPKDYLRD